MLTHLTRLFRLAPSNAETAQDRVARLTQLYERDDEFKALTIKQLHAALWGAFPTRAFNEILWRAQNPSGHARAMMTLARWSASEGRYRDCIDLLNLVNDGPDLKQNRQNAILKLFALVQVSDTEEARELSTRIAQPDEPDEFLIRAVVSSATGRLNILNESFVAAGMPEVESTPAATLLDGLKCPAQPEQNGPRLSVVMPAYNCATVLPTAVNSVLAQTWRNLELIIIDDASTDETADVAHRLAATDPRIVVLQQETNRGAYAARNRGLKAATGEFLTIHDSDDWSHPCKFATQIEALKQAKICTTVGVRVTTDLQPIVRATTSAIFVENMSSLMGRTKDFLELGGWDEVRAGADSEFYERVRFAFDAVPNVIHPHVPLTFIRSEAGSLTQQKATGLKTINYGCRREYRDAYRAWHSNSTKHRVNGRAPFAAPRLITRNNADYNVIAIMDFTDVPDELVREIEMHANSGSKVAISNRPEPTSGGRPATASVQRLLTREDIDLIVVGDTAWAGMIIYPERRTVIAPDELPKIHGVFRPADHDLRKRVWDISSA